MEDLADKATSSLSTSSSSSSAVAAATASHVSTASTGHIPGTSSPSGRERKPSATLVKSENAAVSHAVKRNHQAKAIPATLPAAVPTFKILDHEPSAPVLVNSGTSPSSETMPLSFSAHSLLKKQSRPHKQRVSLSSPPPSASFSISSILTSLQADSTVQEDINSIAEIYGKSRLSLANEYSSHRTPIGPGPDVETGHDDSADDARIIHSLSLDTSLATHRTVNGLETVEELPTPMSNGSRTASNTFIPDISKTVSPAALSARSTASTNEDKMTSRGFLSVWQAGTRQGRSSSRTVQGLSNEVKAYGQPESFVTSQPSELRDDVSGSRGSKAVRQLMRLARS